MHLVSNIVSRLRRDCDPVDPFQTMLPGGIITGCPKVRCMEINTETLAGSPKFILWFCGYFGPGGNLDLNI